MPDGETRVNASTDLQQYIQSVCKDPLSEVPKHDSGWEASYLLGCPPVNVETMSDERKSKLKCGTPRVKQVRLRIMLTEMMSNFMKPEGTYETYLWKMLFHSTHVKLLGSRFCISIIYDYAATTDGLIVCEMNYSERYQPVPMREI